MRRSFFLIIAVLLTACSSAVPAWTQTSDVPPLLTADATPDVRVLGCVGDMDSWEDRDEVEPHVAVSPIDPDHMVAGWMLRAPGGPGGIQVSASRDGGRSWSSPATLPLGACAGGHAAARYASDPWLSIDGEGRVYLSIIEYTPRDAAGDRVSRLVVVTSSDGGRVWSEPVLVAAHSVTGEVHDNTAVGAVPTAGGRAYVTATRYLDGHGPAAVATTMDGGRSWTALRPTPVVSAEAPYSLAPQLLIGQDPEQLWLVSGHDPAGANVAVSRSDDGGGSWTRPTTISSWDRPRGWPLYPGTEDELEVAPDIVSTGIHLPTSHLWVAHQSADTDGRPTVVLLGSADRGRSWRTTEVLGPEEIGWRPTLAVARDGLVVLTWFRPDLAGRSDARRPTAVVGAWFAPLGDGRAEPLDRSTLDRFDWTPRGSGAWFLGDYHGLVTTGDGAVAVYSRATSEGVRVAVRRFPRPELDGAR